MDNACDNFFVSADHATRQKVKFVSYYVALYLKIVTNFQKNIIYLDLFSGPGEFSDGYDSIPLRVLCDAKKYDYKDIRFIFNDNNEACINELKNNVKSINELLPIMDSIEFLSEDAKTIDLSKFIGSDDAVVTFIDSFSYLRADPSTVIKVTENLFSDARRCTP